MQRCMQHRRQQRRRILPSVSDARAAERGAELIDVADAARYLGITEAFVRRLVLERRIRYYKLGKFVRFRAEDLDAFVERGRVEPNVRRLRSAGRRP